MATVYEWIVEEMVGDDINDVNYFESWAAAKASAGDGDCIALHKAVSGRNGDNEDLAVSAYAYIVDGKLPSEFDNGHAVPARFFKEFS